MKLSRRAFIACGAGATALISLFPRFGAAKTKKVAVSLAKVPDLKKVGGSAVVKIKGRKILLARTGDKEVIALDAVCTHEKCLVLYNPKTRKVLCGCHGSEFETNGAVRTGPAQKPLRPFKATVSLTRIVIELDG
jgi:cytochrome b6-f complex iron-sulfur subunit